MKTLTLEWSKVPEKIEVTGDTFLVFKGYSNIAQRKGVLDRLLTQYRNQKVKPKLVLKFEGFDLLYPDLYWNGRLLKLYSKPQDFTTFPFCTQHNLSVFWLKDKVADLIFRLDRFTLSRRADKLFAEHTRPCAVRGVLNELAALSLGLDEKENKVEDLGYGEHIPAFRESHEHLQLLFEVLIHQQNFF